MSIPRRNAALRRRLAAGLLASIVLAALPGRVSAQGETTAAILGEVTDATSAALPGATVTATNHDTGLKRTVAADEAGRFNLPQLPPGTYTVEATAPGFETASNPNVVAGLGQKQTVNFTLRVAASKQTVEVSAEASIVNPANANTSTTLSARALENLPNPGGDLTYPLQFTPGALMNTAGSGNDFVGSSNGYGNVEFNGLPALSNGYIVDGLDRGSDGQHAVLLGGSGPLRRFAGELRHQVRRQSVSRQLVRTVERSAAERGGLFREFEFGDAQTALDPESFWREPGRTNCPRQAVFLFR
jgi:hypothetical protein